MSDPASRGMTASTMSRRGKGHEAIMTSPQQYFRGEKLALKSIVLQRKRG